MGKGIKTQIDLDIRVFRRYPKEAHFSIPLEGRTFNAKTVDYSVNGVGIVIENFPAVNPGDDITLDIDELALHQRARVAWTERLQSGLKAGVLRTGPLKGTLKNYPLPDILIGLQRTLKTGILDVRHGSMNKKVHIKNGDMVFATSNHVRDRLGDILLKNRKINKKQYDKAGEIKRKTGARYTEILLHMGYLRPSELIPAAELQARRIIGSLFTLRDAEFEFTEGPSPPENTVTLDLSVANLIYRAVKKNADVGLLENYLLDSVVDFSSTPLNLFQDISLTMADKIVLSYVDGKTSIRDIIRLSPRNYGETLKVVYALLEARFLVIKDKGKSPSGIRAAEIFERTREGDDALIDEIEEMYSGYENLDYYRILGLDRHVTPDKIKKAYYRAAKKYHPDLHFGLPEDSKKKLLEIFTYITNAYLTLSHPQKREKYNGCVRQDRQGEAETAGRSYRFSALEKDIERHEYDGHLQPDDARFLRNSEIARLRFGEGRTKFGQKKFHEASRLFAMAIYFDGSLPEYHYFYGCALAKLGNLKEAVKALNRANELMPLNADVLAELGHAYMELGFPLRAKGYFDKAIRCDHSNARGTEGIEILGRRKDLH